MESCECSQMLEAFIKRANIGNKKKSVVKNDETKRQANVTRIKVRENLINNPKKMYSFNLS